MQYLLAFILSVFLLCAHVALADEATVRLLAHRSKEYMEHLDRKEFLAMREMLDPEIIQRVPADIFFENMAEIYGEATIFYEKPKVAITNSASAVAYVKIIYFSKQDISVECQHIYWVRKQGHWFISHFISSFSGCT